MYFLSPSLTLLCRPLQDAERLREELCRREEECRQRGRRLEALELQVRDRASLVAQLEQQLEEAQRRQRELKQQLEEATQRGHDTEQQLSTRLHECEQALARQAAMPPQVKVSMMPVHFSVKQQTYLNDLSL